MTDVIFKQNDEQTIVYKFVGGTEVIRDFSTIDMTGKKRHFRITINDEKGIRECIRVR